MYLARLLLICLPFTLAAQQPLQYTRLPNRTSADKPVKILFTRFTKTTRNGEAEEQHLHLPDFGAVTIYPGDKFFTFHFSLSDMYDPAGNSYMYMLKGLDNTWHSIGNQNFISFNGLPAGQYILRIKGKSAKGANSVNEIAVIIRVQQVFYKTGWFILLLLAAAVAIAYAVARYRINPKKNSH